jgi:hypothetical protein
LKNLVYRHSPDEEKLIKALQDADAKLVECMTQIRDMAAEKELKDKELEELKGAAQVVVDMVDPPKRGDNQREGSCWSDSVKPHRRFLDTSRDHQNLSSTHPWARKVLLAKGQSGSTGR